MGKTTKHSEPKAAATPKKEAAAKAPRYKYIGPKVAKMNFPGLRLAFRPALLTDNQIIGILKQYPAMIRYFEDSQAKD